MARLYAKVVGIALLLTSVLGFAVGERSLFGVLNVDLLEDVVHLVTGGLLAYAGFTQRDGVVRVVVLVLGVVYLVVGVLGFAERDAFGLLEHDYSNVDNALHLVLGALALAVALPSSRGAAARA